MKTAEKIINEICSFEVVKKARKDIKDQLDLQISELKELTAIESPTGFEEKRGIWMKNAFENIGLIDCKVDDFGNAIGVLKGSNSKGKIVIEGHMDTVFPIGTLKEITEKDGIIHAVGICDDTRGCTTVLAVARSLMENNIQPVNDIVFMGTTREEGMGGLGGMRDFLTYNDDIIASLSIDGGGSESIVHQAMGLKTYEAVFEGIGGHAMGAFAKVANPLGAAVLAGAKISKLEVPTEPFTTFCLSNVHGGNDEGIHAIPQTATIKYNIRSAKQEELNRLDRKILAILQEAAWEESAKWGRDTIRVSHKLLVDIPAAEQTDEDFIVKLGQEAIKAVGNQPKFMRGIATNANMTIGKGIPSICFGISTDFDEKVHTTEERFKIKDSHKAIEEAFIMAVALAGIKDLTEPAME